MLVTKLKIHRLAEPYAAMIDYNIVPCYNMEQYSLREFIAQVEGKDCEKEYAGYVEKAIQRNYPRFSLGMDESPQATIKVRCTDVVFDWPIVTLIRRFHFFDDYFSEFPDATEVTLPYGGLEVTGAFCLDRSTAFLAMFLNCMKYMNPKSATEYFQAHIGNVPDEELEKLVELLTEEEVADMVEARYYAVTSPPLPKVGSKRLALACILESQYDVKRIGRLFSSYPSYVVLAYSRVFGGCNNDILLTLLVDYDFSQSQEVAPGNSSWILLLLSTISSALALIETREHASRLLAMLGLRYKELDNEGLRVVAPYYAKFYNLESCSELRRVEVRENLERLFGRPFPERWVSGLSGKADEALELNIDIMSIISASMTKALKGRHNKEAIEETEETEEDDTNLAQLEPLDLDAIDFDD